MCTTMIHYAVRLCRYIICIAICRPGWCFKIKDQPDPPKNRAQMHICPWAFSSRRSAFTCSWFCWYYYYKHQDCGLDANSYHLPTFQQRETCWPFCFGGVCAFLTCLATTTNYKPGKSVLTFLLAQGMENDKESCTRTALVKLPNWSWVRLGIRHIWPPFHICEKD